MVVQNNMAISLEQYKQYRKQGLTQEQIQKIDTQSKDRDIWGTIDKAANIISSIFPGKALGEQIGATIAQGILMFEDKERKQKGLGSASQFVQFPDKSKVVADVAQIGLSLAPGAVPPAKSVLGRVGFGTGIGAGTGLTQSIKQGDEPTEVLGKTIGGGIIGLGVSGAFEVVGAGLRALSNSNFLKKMTGATYTKALQPPTKELAKQIEKGFQTTGEKIADAGYVGGLQKMKSQADSNIKLFGGQLDDVLNKYPNVKISKNQIISNTADDLADVFGSLTKQQMATVQREASKLPQETDLKGLLQLKRQLDKRISPTFWVEADPNKSFVQWVNYVFRKNAKVLIENSTDDVAVKEINQKLGLAVDVKELASLQEAIKQKGRNLIPMGRYSFFANILDRTIFNPALTTRQAQFMRGLGQTTGQTPLRQVARSGIISQTTEGIQE